jgi:hypothetical protein
VTARLFALTSFGIVAKMAPEQGLDIFMGYFIVIVTLALING